MVTTNRVVLNQAKRKYSFPNQKVFVSNEFEGARLNDFQETGPGTFTAIIAPENHPINDSGWYGFKIWSPTNQTVHIKLDYLNGKHRYPPHVSTDGEHWQKLPKIDCTVSHDEGTATLTLQIGPKPKFVCGQELFTTKDFKRWLAELAMHPFIHSRVVGQSTLGQPMYEFVITEAGPDAKCVLVLSRQHPPEVTGTFALRAFVETICGDSSVAQEFRKKFKVIVVPEANPDGVDAGNWRHNARGVDLNRDWGQFNQVETRVLRDEFLRIQKATVGKVCFGIDFHSTFHDVFYPSQKTGAAASTPATDSDGGQIDDLVWKWLNEIQSACPNMTSISRSIIRPARLRARAGHPRLRPGCGGN